MDDEKVIEIIEKSLKVPDLSPMKAIAKEKTGIKIFGGLLSCIPFAGGVAAAGLEVGLSYKDYEFFRKFVNYLEGLAQTTAEQRRVFAEEIQKKAEDASGNVILGMVDRLDNIHKQHILANLTTARMNEKISVKDFFRLHSLLERIPYLDLKELPRYKEPYYDEAGDTELLFATGALEMHTIDSKGNSNKYILSRLGELLLRWGLGINIEMEHGKGTNVELDVASDGNIDAIFDERIKELEENQLSLEYDSGREALKVVKGKNVK